MKKIISLICATAMTFTTAGALATPAFAVPLPVKVQSAGPFVQDVQYRRDRQRSYGGVQHRNNYRFERRGNSAYYNGYRGYNDYRPGYFRYNNFWFPATAFVLGAIVGGAITPNSQYGRTAHERWCYDHYRSYRASDDTFQPYHGPRKRCLSPY